MVTPALARPTERMPSTAVRTTWPFSVISMTSSPGLTARLATTGPLRSAVSMLITPLPPRPVSRYSANGVRLPKPWRQTVSTSVPGSSRTRLTRRAPGLRSMPHTPPVSRPVGRHSPSCQRAALPSSLARSSSSAPLVTVTSISSSPSPSLIALIPPARGLP